MKNIKEKKMKLPPNPVPPLKIKPEKIKPISVNPLPQRPNIGDPVIKVVITDKVNKPSVAGEGKVSKTKIEKGEDQHLYQSPPEMPVRPGDMAEK